MAVRRYTIEDKKAFVEAYTKFHKKTKRLKYEEIAKWCNETYQLENKLHGYDFRRPKAFVEWMENR